MRTTLAPDHMDLQSMLHRRIVSAEKIFQQGASAHEDGHYRTFISPLSHRAEFSRPLEIPRSVSPLASFRNRWLIALPRRKYVCVTLRVLPFNEDVLSLSLLTTAAYPYLLRPSSTKTMEWGVWDIDLDRGKTDSMGEKNRGYDSFFFLPRITTDNNR